MTNTDPEESPDARNRLVPLVGIGASAGGLEAMNQLFEALTPDLGLAYLIVSHMDPRHESHLAEVLAKRTTVPVRVGHEQVIEPDNAYVIPPDTVMTVVGNRIKLTARSHAGVRHLPVDALFASLAQQRPGKAIGIVLSGTGSDGTEGVKEIKAAAGVTLAQEPGSAAFDGMPKSAIQTGCIDRMLHPSDMAAELGKIARHPYFRDDEDDKALESVAPEAALEKIFELLNNVYQADFTQYKPNTLQRRLQRRMALVSETQMSSYLELLQDNPVELAALYDDFLIRVTSFFREEAIYTALKQSILPALVRGRSHSDPLRIWVPACATGEEVYSLAICLMEFLGERAQDITIQIFGTDLNEAAIEQARQGSFPESIAERVSAARLQRFFVHENRRYRVAKHIRELCVFARQNVARDPPFSRMDLISCCNLLIYLDTGLQRRVLRHFHYALKPEGFLILGPAENADEESQFFKRTDSSHRMVYRRAMPARGSIEAVLVAHPGKKSATPAEMVQPSFVDDSQVQRKADGLLLSRFAPASILVDDRLNIVQFRGQTSPYLEHASGTASLNLHRVAHPGILLQLVPVIKQAQQSGSSVFKNDLRVDTPTGQREGTVEVIPLREPATKTSFCLILFDANSRVQKPEARPDIPVSEKDARIRQLEEELESLRDYLHATNEAYEAALEESRSAQEELQSANEEFLSGNEELVTAREELQASNEELKTANEEMLSRSRELQVTNNELLRARKDAEFHANYAESLIDTMAHPLLVLDQALCIHRANHAFYDSFLTNPGMTLNRQLFELGDGQWNIPELRMLLDQVLTTSSPINNYRVHHEFPGIGNRSMLLHARKVPAMDNRSARLLLAFEDATAAEDRLVAARADDHRKDEFIAVLAHELRNPLAPIRTSVQVLGLKLKDESMRPSLQMIDRQVTTMTRLIDDLMDISRITRGKLSLSRKPVALVELLKNVALAHMPFMEERGHQLVTVLPESEFIIEGDATRLEQVFGNLLNNAGKYTDRGGHVELRLEVAASEAVVTVVDDGSGIAPDILPHIFDLFLQSETTRSRAEGGLGIGLTLVKQIVEAHGGGVAAVSAGHQRGSRFTVRLPLMQRVPPAEVVEPGNGPNVAFKARRVLVVDDNVDAANGIAELLRMWGHEVALAYDGYAGLEVARTFDPDVALLDIGLPTMTGYALARKLRKAKTEGLFLVAVTGYGQPSDVTAAKESGFDLHVVKPLNVGHMQRLLASPQLQN
ncbi:chemotaxis protein CheB [Acidovorax sp. CCYZU-2555]|uniref:chemotaxis protein CheB n=1 Tax=Acidovorax sp. CCYZU-2555 TaxID=2835042 RepID=UPI001BCABC53|nr:chemotaxis protein CheB [Acidovorax sp. CCYZU-2555]MBS7776738.1 response regulator [Acidovorax sp. CCYZU-2555]